MTILEIALKPATPVSVASARINVDGKEYLILTGVGDRRHWTVLAGRWINDRRALGRTFWSLDDLESHYKKHGAVIREYAERLASISGA